MNYIPSQIIQQTPRIQLQTGGLPYGGRVVAPSPAYAQGGFPSALYGAQQPQHYYQHQGQMPSGLSSPMMRSNLSVFSQGQGLNLKHQGSSNDLGSLLKSPTHRTQESGKTQYTEPVRKHINSNQHFISPQYINQQQQQYPQTNQTQQTQGNLTHNIQRQTSFHHQQLQNSRLTMQSLPAHNATFNAHTATAPNERILSRNLSPQPSHRLNSMLSSPVQRAGSPQQQRIVAQSSQGGSQGQIPSSMYMQGNPYLIGAAQTLYSPTSRPQSPSSGHAQGLIMQGMNNFSQAQQSFYSSGSNFYKTNSFPVQQQQQQQILNPFKLELPQKVQDNQQKLNEAIAKSEKIKKLVAEKQQQMKVNDAKRQEILEVSKLYNLTPHQTAEKPKPQSINIATPVKVEESPIKIVTQVANANTKKVTSTAQSHPINSIANTTESDLLHYGTTPSISYNESLKKPLQVGNKDQTQNIEKREEVDQTLNQLNQNQAEFKKLQQEFKLSTNKLKDVSKPQLQHTPINLLQKGAIANQQLVQMTQPSENKENIIIATPISVNHGGDLTPTGDQKIEFKSTVNQFRKSFQKNMYQTPVNAKKKFQKKVFENHDEFQGSMENDIPSGFGILKDKNGKEIYKGDWKSGQQEGSGIFVNRNYVQQQEREGDNQIDHNDLTKIIEQNVWQRYEGDMKQNKIQGFGTMYFYDNLKFVGNFENGIPHGQGSFYTKDGKIVAAIWELGILQEILWD